MNEERGHAEQFTPGHEPLTISVRGVVIGTIALVVLIGATVLAMWPLVRALDPHRADQAESLTEHPVESPPNTVGLNPNQAEDRLKRDEQQRAWLGEYAWLSEDEQVARIPIERAMQIVRDRGLRAATETDAAPTAAGDEVEGDGGTP